MFVFNNNCDIRQNSYVAIRLTRACDNDCIYCISKTSVNQVCDNPKIDKIVKTIKDNNIRDIVIEGGEPLLRIPEVLELVTKIRPLVNKINIYTACPKTCINQFDDLIKIFNIVDSINFSMQHCNKNIANKLRHVKKDYNRLNVIKKLLAINSDKVRVSFNLVRGYLDTYEDLIDNIKYWTNFGIKHLRISEMISTPKYYVSIDKLLQGKKGANKLNSPYAFGCKTTLKAYDFLETAPRDIDIVIRRACFMVEPLLKATIWDLLKIFIMAFKVKRNHKKLYNFKVILEDGTLHENWNLDTIN
jgi:molybdenum cofactor biosynthesis enzyme MoaA